MKNQKYLEILVIVFALLAISFVVTSCIYLDNKLSFRIVSGIFILFSICLNVFSNYKKKKM